MRHDAVPLCGPCSSIVSRFQIACTQAARVAQLVKIRESAAAGGGA
jgi:hypothetical protein